MTYSFLNDYSEGCHPSILDAMTAYNLTQQMGYGADSFSAQAKTILNEKINQPDADIHFVTGGTQANLICLASMLKPFEAIIAPDSGHISVNEAGAIEATGHKVITLPSAQGKLTVTSIETAVKQFSMPPHKVRPKVVYISNATELGTVYTKAELTALYQCCQKHELYLFMDGARLGVALASKYNDLTLAEVAELTDMFWLGGTKMGAFLGEAIIINNDALKPDFAFHIKQRGAMLAKGSLLGVQFHTLLSDDTYLQLSTHANAMAQKISNAIVQAGYQLHAETQSNQIFALLPHELIQQLNQAFLFYEWQKYDTNSLVRLVTSWATNEEQVDKLIAMIQSK